jgi:hypothetical protein
VHVICGSNGRPKLLPDKYRNIFGSAAVTPASKNNSRELS